MLDACIHPHPAAVGRLVAEAIAGSHSHFVAVVHSVMQVEEVSGAVGLSRHAEVLDDGAEGCWPAELNRRDAAFCAIRPC